jgi:hypothetical protein
MRRSTCLLVLSLLVAATFGCTGSRPARLVVVFVDVSASVKDFAVYRDAWAKIVGALQPGDRMILAQISDRTYTGFRPLPDYEVPRFSPWHDNKLVFEKQWKALQATFASMLDRPLSAPRSQRTDIFGALLEAEKVFKGDRRQGTLIILSDMLEDSEAYNFEKQRFTDAFLHGAIADAARKGRLPDLSGARVYVAGASAQTTGRACDVQKFWLAYIKAANGKLSPENYGPALMNFGQ